MLTLFAMDPLMLASSSAEDNLLAASDGAYATATDPPLPALVDLPSIDFNMARIWLISERPERGLRGFPDGITESVAVHARACPCLLSICITVFHSCCLAIVCPRCRKAKTNEECPLNTKIDQIKFSLQPSTYRLVLAHFIALKWRLAPRLCAGPINA